MNQSLPTGSNFKPHRCPSNISTNLLSHHITLRPAIHALHVQTRARLFRQQQSQSSPIYTHLALFYSPPPLHIAPSSARSSLTALQSTLSRRVFLPNSNAVHYSLQMRAHAVKQVWHRGQRLLLRQPDCIRHADADDHGDRRTQREATACRGETRSALPKERTAFMVKLVKLEQQDMALIW